MDRGKPGAVEQVSATLPPRVTLFGAPIDPWSMELTIAEIGRRMRQPGFTQHAALNVAKLVHMQRDPVLRAAVTSCEIINADGMGVVWGARLLGSPVPERVPGIDLFLRLVAKAAEAGDPVFLLGARPAVVESARDELERRFPGVRIAGTHHGYFWDDEARVVRQVAESRAALLFVAITSPLKEQFIARYRERLGVRFAMGVGGAFDILAGVTRRAPRGLQSLGLEWLYRAVQEPRRMGRRYLGTNAQFATMMVGALLRRLGGGGGEADHR